MKLAIALLLILAVSVAAEEKAVLVCGSSSYGNYRHQADVCHAYHILIDHGYKAENIIVMSYDDAPSSSENPFPGQLFNKPTEGEGKDVYAGCKINYKGEDVTPENYIAIITGDKASVKGGDGSVLESTAEDNVFLNFADHGAEGLIAFPSSYLYADKLLKAFQTMHDKKMYKQLTYYLEACESGSMFQKLSKDLNIYAVSAASPTESSWGTYCPPDDKVNGKELNTCLGDLFSVNWMEDSDKADTSKETLQQQYEAVKKLTDKSQVMQWGDVSWTSEVIGEFIGMKNSTPLLGRMARHFNAEPRKSVQMDSRDIMVNYLTNAYLKNPTQARYEALQKELASIKKFNEVFEVLTDSFGLTGVTNGETNFDCYRNAINTMEAKCGKIDEHSLAQLKYLHEFCAISDNAEYSELLNVVFDELC